MVICVDSKDKPVERAARHSFVTYSGLPGTCAGRPGRWSCWRCRGTVQHMWTGHFSRWERTPAHDCAPPHFYQGSIKKKRKKLFSLIKQVVLYNTGLKDQSVFVVLLAQMGQMSRRYSGNYKLRKQKKKHVTTDWQVSHVNCKAEIPQEQRDGDNIKATTAMNSSEREFSIPWMLLADKAKFILCFLCVCVKKWVPQEQTNPSFKS